MPSPRPVPDEIKRLNGYPGKRGAKDDQKSKAQINESLEAAKALSGIGEPFPDMTAAAKLKWAETAVTWRLILKESDRFAFRMFCETWIDLMEAQTQVLIHGSVVPNVTGSGFKETKWAVRVDKLRSMIHKMLSEFGATPSARTKVTLSSSDPAKQGSKFSGLLTAPGSNKVN